MPITITARVESWPLAQPFRIARGVKHAADVVVASIDHDGAIGQGECVPYARYGETIESTQAVIHTLKDHGHGSVDDLEQAIAALPAGAARNALDCALWDWRAKRAPSHAAQRLPKIADKLPLTTAFTLSLDDPASMAQAATRSKSLPLLKLKLGHEDWKDDAKAMRAVRAAAPDADLIVDANEGWTSQSLPALMDAAAMSNVKLIEQPLPAHDDAALAGLDRPVAICADESCHTTADVEALSDRYDAINIKLDKAGGLTEALKMVEHAHSAGLGIMIGCMVATSRAMAPALHCAATADTIDLDGPLLLARDHENGLRYADGRIIGLTDGLWGLPDH